MYLKYNTRENNSHSYFSLYLCYCYYVNDIQKSRTIFSYPQNNDNINHFLEVDDYIIDKAYSYIYIHSYVICRNKN